MSYRDYISLPRCTVDYPLEFTDEEIAKLTDPINTLLKSTYLLGPTRDIEATFQTLFDFSEEISNTDCYAYVSGTSDSEEFEVVFSRHIPLSPASQDAFFTPVEIARHFNKTVLLDSEIHPQFKSICEAWSCRSLLAFPLRHDRDFIGALVFGKGKSHPFKVAQVKLLWFIAMQAENRLLQGEAMKTLSFYSFLDPLTHLYNRRYFDDQLDKEIFRSRRSGKPFSLMMLDIDDFKAYNDKFLHTAGDIALQEFSGILREVVREVDTVSRFGGDEFAVILEESGAEGARDLANRLIERFARHMLPGIDNFRTERLSTSIGIASFPADSFDKQDLVRKADRALYLAKNQGKGKVCLYHEIADLLTVKKSPSDLPVQKIYEAARSVVHMDKFLEILLFTAMQGLSADRGSIVVRDSNGNYILRAAVGFSNGEERLSPGIPIPPGTVTTWVIEHGEPLVVSGPGDMPTGRKLKKNGYRSDSFLSLPLIHEGHRLGAIHLTNRKEKRPFSREDAAAFVPIAGEIASILHQGLVFRENVKQFSSSLLHSLINALELRFPFLSGHSRRVADLACRIGCRLGFGTGEMNSLVAAACLHDVGLIGIPSSLLIKKQRLTDNELGIVQKHSFLGSKMLEGVPDMDETRRMILEHHEHFDGSGYPYGLRGEEISLGARILSLAEFYDSVTSERPHRGKLLPEEALQLVRNNMNTLFDKRVCQAFIETIQ